ncbi:MAG: hypothetical protein ACP5E5_14880, partial [Acidobacteriaceae bacterium]
PAPQPTRTSHNYPKERQSTELLGLDSRSCQHGSQPSYACQFLQQIPTRNLHSQLPLNKTVIAIAMI